MHKFNRPNDKNYVMLLYTFR